MKTPTLIGTIIFGISLLVVAIGALRLDFLDPSLPTQEYFELFFIWIAGIAGGIGLGYGSRESYGYSEGNNATIIGGLGLTAAIIISVWMFVQETPPLMGVIIGFVGAILAIVGLYMMVVSTQESI
ncbi:MAG: hypothetical protein EAX86_08755 [Candidatus Heimdallarchaeota archaeon]|nr:hypothetical protein [Candidatus Heimdallarchaeota archaeon]